MSKKAKKTAGSFTEELAAVKEKREINSCGFTGMAAGTIVALLAGYRALCSVGIKEVVFILLFAAGCILFLLGGLAPSLLVKPLGLLSKAGGKIGTFLLRLLSAVVYLPVLLCAVLFAKKKRRNYEFIRWNDPGELAEPSFLPYREAPTGRSGSFGLLGRLISLFSENRTGYLIPVILLLVLIGLLFFFFSSSSVFVFVYTLF